MNEKNFCIKKGNKWKCVAHSQLAQRTCLFYIGKGSWCENSFDKQGKPSGICHLKEARKNVK